MSVRLKSQLALICILLVARYDCTPLTINNQRIKRHNVSLLLDRLLVDYDNSLRPDIRGSATMVEVDIMVRSMGPISEADMTYSMDCYFRQTWRDTRLSHQHSKSDPLALSVFMLNRIWKPDTYFYNGKNSYLHTITTPNKLVRLFPDGRILYSSRLTIKASCPMNLHNFPLDYQMCPLYLGSFAYTKEDVIYRWNRDRQIAIEPGMKMSQFDLISTPVGNYSHTVKNGEYSMLQAQFHLRRHTGSFLIQVYGPCILLVVLSWVSFWLNREATADRVSLGVTTVLTMTFLGLEARSTLPKVSYPTALDHFIFLSFGFIFATILQFAVVHYFTKYGFGEIYFFGEANQSSSFPASYHHKTIGPTPIYSIEPQLAKEDGERPGETSVQVTLPVNNQSNDQTCTNNPPAQRLSHARDLKMNSVSKIDKISRVLFPLLFIAINFFYWCTYNTNYP